MKTLTLLALLIAATLGAAAQSLDWSRQALTGAGAIFASRDVVLIAGVESSSATVQTVDTLTGETSTLFQGRAFSDMAVSAVARMADGSVVVAGRVGTQGYVARRTAAGDVTDALVGVAPTSRAVVTDGGVIIPGNGRFWLVAFDGTITREIVVACGDIWRAVPTPTGYIVAAWPVASEPQTGHVLIRLNADGAELGRIATNGTVRDVAPVDGGPAGGVVALVANGTAEPRLYRWDDAAATADTTRLRDHGFSRGDALMVGADGGVFASLDTFVVSLTASGIGWRVGHSGYTSRLIASDGRGAVYAIQQFGTTSARMLTRFRYPALTAVRHRDLPAAMSLE